MALARSWLFTGPEIGQKKQKIESIKAQIQKEFGELETHVYYAYETDFFEVLNQLQSISLFSNPSFIEYRNAELLKEKNAIQALENWIKISKTGINFLVLTSDEISVDKKIDELFTNDTKQIFWELFENKKQEWIKSFFSKYNLSISNDAIDAILELVENNTDALKNQCQHLAIFFEKGHCIEASEIESLLSHNKSEDVFTLYDALTYGETEKAFSILSTLLLSKNVSAVQLVIGLASCFRKLQDYYQYLQRTGERSTDATLRRFGVISKKAISQHERATRRWNADAVQNILHKINTCDFEIRKQGQALHSILLETLVLYIVQRS